MLTLFHQFINWPGYDKSPFLASLESSLIKLETVSDGTIENSVFRDDEVADELHPVTGTMPKGNANTDDNDIPMTSVKPRKKKEIKLPQPKSKIDDADD